MDLHDRWQENKRWVSGVLLGVVVFFIAASVVRSVFSSEATERAMTTDARAIGANPLYDVAAQKALEAEAKALDEAAQKLRAELEFKPREQFLLQGKSEPPDLYFLKLSTAMRSRLLREADSANVDVSDKSLQWTTPSPEDTQAWLIALNVIDDAVTRLLAAHRAVRDQNPEALGLRAITEFKVEDPRAAAQRGRWRASPAGGKADAGDTIAEQAVRFSFTSDAATAYRFLEACDDPERPLALSALKIAAGELPGDPVVVTGKLGAITFRDT